MAGNEVEHRLFGQIMALNHLVTALFGDRLRAMEDPVGTAAALRAQMLAEHEPDHVEGVTGPHTFAISQHALAFLEDWWARMERHLEDEAAASSDGHAPETG
jgi:hypothetical protein